MKLLENRKFQLVLCVLFSAVALTWIIISHPQFPILSLIGFELPFRFPVIGFLPAIWLLYFQYKKWAFLALLLFVPLCMLFNLNMLRPDFYLLWLLLLVASLSKNKEQLYSGFLLVLFGMYFYTAVQKLHADFFTGMARVFDKRILSENLPAGSSKALAISIPIMELLLALFCISPYKKLRMVLGVALHSGILYFILVGGWNYGMVIWNFSLLILHVLLPAFDRKNIIQHKGTWLTPVGFSMLMPISFLLGIGPVFSSWNMYSAKTIPYRLQIDEATAKNPPAYVRDFVYSKNGVYSISVNEWADYEIGGAPCMEKIFADELMIECNQYIKEGN